MTFTTIQFLIFLIVVFALYYIIPKKCQWMLLLVASYAFYAYSGLSNLIYIVITTISTYYMARKIENHKEKTNEYLKRHKDLDRKAKKEFKNKAKKVRWNYLLFTLILNFGILAIVKYTDFMIGNVNALLGTNLGFFRFAVPLGISYYTFMTMGYIIDVYRGKEAQHNLFKFALFASFLPSLIQGPIGRYTDTAKTLYSEHTLDSKTFYFGVQRIIWGFFKKMVLADRIFVACKTLFADPNQYSGLFVIVGLVFYGLDIYADFTGGIDITIGIAELFGIKLTENFERPYFSKDLAEFWRRWHITMGTWFKDYIFYPISVCKPMLKLSKWSRKHLGETIGKRLPVYLATLIVWFLTGIWHGAAWSFIAWGLGNAVVLLLSSEFDPFYKWFHKKFDVAGKTWFKLFQILRTFGIVSLLRIFDCYGDVPLAFHQLSTVITNFNPGAVFNGALMNLGLTGIDYIILIVGVVMIAAVSLAQRKGSVRERLYQTNGVMKFAIIYGLIIVIALMGAYGTGYDASSFIYNQF